MTEPRLFAVAGKPVLHSKSPDMFNRAFAERNINSRYLRLAAQDAGEIIQTMRDVPICGMNITAPFKEEMAGRLDELDDQANLTGAVNTVVFSDGKLRGFNTDIEGVSGALAAHGIAVMDKKAVVLGAGGAASAAAAALLSQGAQVTIINRTYEKAEALARRFSCNAAPINDLGQALQSADILVSCLSTAELVVPPAFLKKDLVVMDALYGKETALVRDAKSIGCTVIDGREWLLRQGVAAYSRFIGEDAPADIMSSALYSPGIAGKRSIALIGFMGTGKSTVGPCLAEILGMPFVDVDAGIEKREAKTISEIFAGQGEAVFRRMESAEIEAQITGSPCVLACGGGAVLDEGNVARLREQCIVVWLYAGIDNILERIGEDRTRPLLNGDNKRKRVEELLRQRVFFYGKAADMLIRTDNRTAREVAKRIYDESSQLLTH